MKRSRLYVIVIIALLTACTSDVTPTPSALGPTNPGPAVGSTATSPAGNPTPAPSLEIGSVGKIEAAEQAGRIDHDTALVYKLYAALDYSSLPVEYQSDNSDADPEGTTILAELNVRFDQLTPDLKAKVEPFFKRPTEPDSIWARRMSTTGNTTKLASAVLAPAGADTKFDYVDDANKQVRVWYATRLGDSEKQLATRLAAEIDSSDMWKKEKKAMLGRAPCSDGELPSPLDGGSDALDMYLIYPATGLAFNGRLAALPAEPGKKPANGVTIPRYGVMCPVISYIALNATLPFDRLKNTTAHELFHTFQNSFKNAVQPDRYWWMEASAEWAEDLVYPEDNYEQLRIEPYWAHAPGSDGPLDNPDADHAYAAYIWAFYLRQKAGGDETVVGKLWQASETKASIEAMRDLSGWEEKFKEFALWNWNKKPMVKYQDGYLPISNIMLGQDPTCIAGSTEECIITLGKRNVFVGLGHASAQYFAGTPEIDVEQLNFDLKETRGKPGAGVQAIIQIGNPGQLKSEVLIEDWSDLDKRDFCMAREDVHSIVLVVSNSSIGANDTLSGKIGVDAIKGACPNILTYTETQHWNTSGPASSDGVNPCTEHLSTHAGHDEWRMVFVTTPDGKTTLTESKHTDDYTELWGCTVPDQPESGQTEHILADASGVVTATVEWSVTPEGKLTWQGTTYKSVKGTRTITTIDYGSSCPKGCERTRTEDVILPAATWYYTEKVDPKASVIVGQTTDDQSTAGKTYVIITTWSLGK